MKWIKASERVPDHYRLVHLQYNNADKIFSKATARYNPSMGHWLAVNGFELKGCTDLEWLDESAPASAEEEAARLYPNPNKLLETDTLESRFAEIKRQAHIRCAGMYTGEIETLKAENSKMRQALINISNPIDYLRKYAESQGGQLDGNGAVTLSNDPSFLKSLATEAL